MLTLVWLAIHVIPFLWLTDGRYYYSEIVESRTTLAYGFWARKGAYFNNAMSAGIFPNPADFNYVNHPYPIIWVYTFLYWLFGQAGVFVLIAIAGLLSCWLTYRFLKECFSVRIAWFTIILITAAHATVEFATNSDILAQSAIIWPLAGVAIIALRSPSPWLKGTAPWLLGLIVFLCGQMSWFALTTVPVLLLLCVPPNVSLREAIRRPASVPGWVPIIAGSLTTSAVFLGQIVLYSPDLAANLHYLRAQSGTAGGGFLAQRLKQAPVLLLRMLQAGPALWLGGVIGLTQLRKKLPQRRVAGFVSVYFVIFGMVMFAIPRLLFLNEHAFRFNLWPCAILTAFALTSLETKWLRRTLVAVALPSLLLCYAKIHDYRASEASVALGRWLAANTKPTDIIFSNLSELKPPIQPWDGECFATVNAVADRYMSPAAVNEPSLIYAAKPFKGLVTNAVFLLERTQPIDPALELSVTSSASILVSTNLAVPPEHVAIFKVARASLWKLLGRNAPKALPASSSEAPHPNSFSLKLYNLSPGFIRDLNQKAVQAANHPQ